MDDPGLRWPYWKFGYKRDDLFTKLHDQYNTTVQYISDPVAFQHDVFEISHEASTADEFHQLMAARKEHRLNELNRSLESASFEIIANPALIGTEQWQHAVQLFRTRSLDSLVRYFASYLPEDHPWHHSDISSASSLSGDSEIVDDESTSHSENTMFFDEDLDSKLESYEDPFEADEQKQIGCISEPTDASTNAIAAGRTDEYPFEFVLTPSRTLSFSDSEPDLFHLKDSCPSLHDDDASQTSASSVSDISETQHQKELLAEQDIEIVKHPAEYFSEPQSLSKDDGLEESETPTPKPRADSGECFFMKPKPTSLSASARIPGRRDTSPFRNHLSHAATASLGHSASVTVTVASRRQMEQQYSQTQSPSPARSRRRDHSPVGKGRSHSAAVTSGRVQKLSDYTRSRNRGRRTTRFVSSPLNLNPARAVGASSQSRRAASDHGTTRTEFHTVTVSITSTVTRNTTSTIATQTVTKDAAFLESASRDEPWKVWASEHEAVDRLRKRQSMSTTAEFPTKTPAYASQCSDSDAYRSACSCLGVNSTAVTADTPTATSTVVITAFKTQTKVSSHFDNATTTRFARLNATTVSNNATTDGSSRLFSSTSKLNSQASGSPTFERNVAAFATGLSQANGTIVASRNGTLVGSSQTDAATAVKVSSLTSSAVLPKGTGSKAPHAIEDGIPTTKAVRVPFPMYNSTGLSASNSSLGVSGLNSTANNVRNKTSPNNGTWPARLPFGSLPTSARFGSNNTALNMTHFDVNATRANAKATSVRAPFAFLNATGTSSARLSNTTDPARWRNNTIPRFTNTSTSTTATIDKTCGETSTPFAIKVAQDGGTINDWFLRLSGNSILFTSQSSRSSRFAVGGSGRLCAVGAKGPLDNAIVAVVENKTGMATSPLWFVDGGLVANLTARGYAELNCTSGGGTLACAYNDMRNWLGCGLQLGLSSSEGGDFEGIKCQGVSLMTKEGCGAGGRGNSTMTRLPGTQSNEAGVATALPITVGLPTTYSQIR
ncbi:hypothetical protein PpBr36_04190 [Pyricularia pennisetigena]|uniref:hypothetical protein n=1 Tax=Pyricularia pennisetigena TaxID=1578925 RepID=UPI00114F6E5D|nr:hypothetical protein PpBr36_04190 [Pyricularia pennisetigena]TLS26466.1 hypothetical protein PpBr36_04190 [Pyricularia pennisetigena]